MLLWKITRLFFCLDLIDVHKLPTTRKKEVVFFVINRITFRLFMTLWVVNERNLQRPKKTKLLKNQKESEKGCLRFSYCLFLTFVYFNILVLFWSHFSLQKYARISLYKSRICFYFLTGTKPKNNVSSCILENSTSQRAITASACIPIICTIFYSTALSRRVEKNEETANEKSV